MMALPQHGLPQQMTVRQAMALAVGTGGDIPVEVVVLDGRILAMTCHHAEGGMMVLPASMIAGQVAAGPGSRGVRRWQGLVSSCPEAG